VLVAPRRRVVGDMAGLWLRTGCGGIAWLGAHHVARRWWNPAIGGKTGVNHPVARNLIGAFHQTRLVLIDPSTPGSPSPAREFRAGIGK